MHSNKGGQIRECLSFSVAVFEIKHLFCTHIGCRGTQNRAPGVVSVCTDLYNA